MGEVRPTVYLAGFMGTGVSSYRGNALAYDGTNVIAIVAANASLVGLPAAEVVQCFADLVAAELVTLSDAPPPPAESGVFPCIRPM